MYTRVQKKSKSDVLKKIKINVANECPPNLALSVSEVLNNAA